MKINSTGITQDMSKIIQNSYQNKAGSDFQKVLKQAQKEQDDEKLREACQDIEAMFIHQMLKQMRSTIPESGLIAKSNAEEIYQDMLDEKYSEIMAQSQNNLGLADLIYEQLKLQENAVDNKTEKE